MPHYLYIYYMTLKVTGCMHRASLHDPQSGRRHMRLKVTEIIRMIILQLKSTCQHAANTKAYTLHATCQVLYKQNSNAICALGNEHPCCPLNPSVPSQRYGYHRTTQPMATLVEQYEYINTASTHGTERPDQRQWSNTST